MNCPRCRSGMEQMYDIDWDRLIYVCTDSRCQHSFVHDHLTNEYNIDLDPWLSDWSVPE